MLYYRHTLDTKNWWHWMPKCQTMLSRGTMKRRGAIFTTLLVESGYPLTGYLCPACVAEALRVKTKAASVYVRRMILPKKVLNPSFSPMPPPVDYNRPLLPNLTTNPVTTVVVRRDEAYK